MNPASQHQNVFISFVQNGQKQHSSRTSRAHRLKFTVPDKQYCDKCRFSSRDHIQFQKHVSQHEEMTFSCSYCSHVSYTKGESQRHLVSHTGTFPYKCQFCDYGAIRNDYIVKHTERVHRCVPERSNGIRKKMLTLNNSPSLSSTWHASRTSSHTSVTAKTTSPSAGMDANSSKLDLEKTNRGSGLAKLQVELLAPLNEPIQHDRPLTVTYPPELSIPPGCFVELVEVKTVNGTKELELKLVSQHLTEEDSIEKGLEDRKKEVGENEKASMVKPSFRCSLIPQEEKTISLNSLGKRQHMQQGGSLSVIKDLLARPPAASQEKHPMTFKEEPEEHDIEIGGKTQSVIQRCKDQIPAENGNRCEHNSKSVDLMNFKDLNSPTRINAECISQKIASTKTPPQASVTKEFVAHKWQKPIVTCNKQAQRVIGLSPSDKQYQEESPVVSKTFVRSDDEVGSADKIRPEELPVISSVFSLHSGHEDITACVGWQHTKNQEGHSVPLTCPEETQEVGCSSVVSCSLQSAAQDLMSNENSLHVNTASTMINTNEHVKENRKCNFQKHTDKKASLDGSLSRLQQESQPSSLLHQNTSVFEENKSSLCHTESGRNMPDIVDRSKNQGNTEDSQPVFIPEGTKFKISVPNHQSQKTSAMSTDISLVNGTWMPRAVLSCGASEQNIANAGTPSQHTGLKLSLKRRRSGAENEGLVGHWVQLDSQAGEDPNHGLKPCKQKKRRKKHKKASKMKVVFQKSGVAHRSKQWLIPLKEDQLVTFPSPNQPVVILNHPRPQTHGKASDMHAVRIPKPVWSPASRSAQQVPCDLVQTHRLLKMKLKKVNQNKYQVVGFIYRDFPAKTLKY